ncbi:cytochrome c biogenesis protein CcsA, partial [Porticoccaceae bacterium]|nr:cytochrome c biogenesis protein CcsA [Porticoccaceae bacterium]
MNPELGQIALIIALMLSTFQAFVPMVGSFVGAPAWMKLGQSMALGQFVFAGVAFTCLSWAFVTNDFSVAYVANNSNTLLPLHYKLSAVWGAHEGSLLLWVLILAGWSAMVAIRSDQMPPVFTARVLSVLGFISVGFLLFLLLTSNPFERILPIIPAQGSDLNPLLQDIGLIL